MVALGEKLPTLKSVPASSSPVRSGDALCVPSSVGGEGMSDPLHVGGRGMSGRYLEGGKQPRLSRTVPLRSDMPDVPVSAWGSHDHLESSITGHGDGIQFREEGVVKESCRKRF